MDLTPIEKATTSKTFCIYPWIHQYVGPGGEVKPCCIYEPDGPGLGNIKKAPLKEVWNNNLTKQMRLDMLNGVEIPGCSMCNVRVGVTRVHRDDTNDVWFEKNKDTVSQTLDDGTLPEHKLKYIDARFNNLCNLKCRTCSPHFSTGWHEDYEKMRKPDSVDLYPKTLLIPGNTDSQLLDEIMPHLSEVERIYFAGGEPLMQKEHYAVLEELIRIKHTGTTEKPLILQYSTNFTSLTLGKHNVLDYWNKFARVLVNASLDGSHERAEYWRKGTNWEKIVQNRIDLKKACPRVIFNIGFTLSWVNAFNLLDLHKEWVEKYYININSMTVNILDHPGMYSLKYIPNWKKKKIEEAFLKHIEWIDGVKRYSEGPKLQAKERFMNAIKFMYDVDSDDNSDVFLSKGFLSTTTELDKLRNENFWDVFPEHADMKEFIYGSNSL